jgi:hypothetical protein
MWLRPQTTCGHLRNNLKRPRKITSARKFAGCLYRFLSVPPLLIFPFGGFMFLRFLSKFVALFTAVALLNVTFLNVASAGVIDTETYVETIKKLKAMTKSSSMTGYLGKILPIA